MDSSSPGVVALCGFTSLSKSKPDELSPLALRACLRPPLTDARRLMSGSRLPSARSKPLELARARVDNLRRFSRPPVLPEALLSVHPSSDAELFVSDFSNLRRGSLELILSAKFLKLFSLRKYWRRSSGARASLESCLCN